MTTPNMGLDLPTPSTTAGPLWASMLVAALLLIDEHDHSTGNGSSIPSSAIVWPDNTDLQTIGLFNANFYGFQAVSAQPDAETMLWVDGDGELHYHDQSAHDIQLTLAGALNLTGTRGINGDYATDAANPSAHYDTTPKRYTFDSDDADTRASVAVAGLFVGVLAVSADHAVGESDPVHTVAVDSAAAVHITLPSAANNPGRIIVVKDATGGASTHAILITRVSGGLFDGATTKTITTDYGLFRFCSDGAKWMVV